MLLLAKLRENKLKEKHSRDSDGVQKRRKDKKHLSSNIINSIKTKTLVTQVLFVACWDACEAADLSFPNEMM